MFFLFIKMLDLLKFVILIFFIGNGIEVISLVIISCSVCYSVLILKFILFLFDDIVGVGNLWIFRIDMLW